VYSPLINMYRRTRQLSKAIPLAERLVELFPDNQVFRAQVESLYRELGRPDAG
jgi:lipopolysaccharide biosynthesis regulator YciM